MVKPKDKIYIQIEHFLFWLIEGNFLCTKYDVIKCSDCMYDKFCSGVASEEKKPSKTFSDPGTECMVRDN